MLNASVKVQKALHASDERRSQELKAVMKAAQERDEAVKKAIDDAQKYASDNALKGIVVLKKPGEHLQALGLNQDLEPDWLKRALALGKSVSSVTPVQGVKVMAFVEVEVGEGKKDIIPSPFITDRFRRKLDESLG